MTAYRTETIKHLGRSFRVEHFADEHMGAPWEEHDGHGIISEWTCRDKKPGEVEIAGSRGGKRRFYDVQETTRVALRDGWGVEKSEGLTKHQIAAAAVREDLKRMAEWCNDGWFWMGIVVTPLDEEGNALESRSESLWGIESDSRDYHAEVAAELAEQCDVSPVGV